MWRKATWSVAQPPNEGGEHVATKRRGERGADAPVDRGRPRHGVDKRAVFGWAVHPEGAATEPVPQRAWSWRLHARTGEAYVVAVLVSPASASGGREAVPRDGSFWKGVRKGVRGKAGGETGMAAQPEGARAVPPGTGNGERIARPLVRILAGLGLSTPYYPLT